MIGRELSHFRIVGELGAGGMGVVYRAIDVRLGRPVALKVLPPTAAAEAGQRERLRREAQAASALSHPNIVTVYEVDFVEGAAFIAMELVDGRSLDALIPATGMSLEKALAYAIPIADALARAHRAGIVHRDLKPRNVMVTAAGVVKVLDFGLAKRLGPAISDASAETGDIAARTETGALVGTPRYMSPEQAQGRRVDARTDVYAFGVLLFEMLAGRPPFTGNGVADVLAALLRDPAPPLESLRRDVPAEASRLVAKALEKDPELRYRDLGDLLVDLRRLAREPSAGRPTGRRLRPATIAALALGVAALAAGVLWRVWPGASAPARFRLLSTFPGSHRSPSLSPDGRMLAYVDAADGVAQVFVKYLDGGDPLQITSGKDPVVRPRWSPRGDRILFERSGRPWTVSPLGGDARPAGESGGCPAWFPDGERIVFDRAEELWTARLDGSGASRVDGVPVNYFSFMIRRCAVVSPDGRHIAFYQPERGPFGDFWVVPSEGGTPRRLTHDSSQGGGLAWAADGASLVLSSGRRGSRNLWRVGVNGGDPQPITTGAGEDDEPDVSRDGARIVYTNTKTAWTIVIFDPRTGARRTIVERRGHVNGPDFSPRGDRIAFFAIGETDGLEKLFSVDVAGGAPRQVAGPRGEALIMPRWSADAATLFFYRDHPRPAFMRVGAEGGAPEVVIDGWQYEVQNFARPDPGGSALVYSLVEGGEYRATLIRDLGSGKERRLAQPIDWPRWSRDGRSIAGSTGERVFVCSAAEGSCTPVGEGSAPCWSGDGKRLYVRRGVRGLDDPSLVTFEIWTMGADGRDPRRVTVVESQHVLGIPFDVSVRDEIAWPEARPGKQELWLAETGAR
jgi:serine/threonine protein kinase